VLARLAEALRKAASAFAADRAYKDRAVVLARLAEAQRHEWRKMWSDGGDMLAGTQGRRREKKQDGLSNRPT
jgi:hypothetical protein